MRQGVKIEEFRFPALLDHAVKNKYLFGGFQWYGTPIAPDMPQSNLLNGQVFYGTADFHDVLAETFRYCQTYPDAHGLDHAMIFVFDGRNGSKKFHNYIWRPETGDTLQPVDYGRCVNQDSLHSRCAFAALMAQKKPVKVSTVARAGLAKLRDIIGEGTCDERQLMGIRSALSAIINTDPLINTQRVENSHIPGGGYTLVEHLGIYDKDATWLK